MARHLKIEEPKFADEMTTIQLMNTLNWYHQNKEYKDGVSYIQDYAKKNKIPGRVNTSKSILTLAWVCRLVMNGNNVGEKGIKYIKEHIKDVMQVELVKILKVDITPTISIQDRMKEKISEIAGDLEGAIDDYIESGYVQTPSAFSIMQNRAKGLHAQRLIEQFKKRRVEFDDVLHTKDSDTKEAYSNFTKPQLKKIIAFCDSIITDAMKIAGESKVNRKPRKRKLKTADQLIAKVKYCVEFAELKLKSVSPKEIIGAMQLWVYNIKTRKLGCYHAEDAGGFSIKVTTITNYNETKSVQKILRKPNVTLPEVLTGGKVYMRNLIDGIQAVESPLRGRINEDVVLVRIIK
jgi:hypothetical protein